MGGFYKSNDSSAGLAQANQQQATADAGLAGIWDSPAEGVVPKSTSAASQKKQFLSYYVIVEKLFSASDDTL
jgi:hypothetical protein